MNWFVKLVGRISLWHKKHKAMAAVRKNKRAAARIMKQIQKERAMRDGQ